MRTLPFLVALVVLASACVSAPEEPEEPAGKMPRSRAGIDHLVHRASDLLPAGSFGANLTTEWLSVGGYDGREPTVAVDPKGALYYAARDYSGGKTPPVSATQTPIMKSTDGGVTWRDVSPKLPTGDREPPRSGDPMVIADPWTGRIFQIELYDLVCNWLVFSDDQGATWRSNPKACSSLVVDHQTIGAGPPAAPVPRLPLYPNLVYVCVNQIADSHCSRSLDGGLTFETYHLVFPGVRSDNQRVCGGIHGHVMVAPDGTVYLPREYCGDGFVGVSRDNGLTWELKDIDGGLQAMSNDPNMGFDAAGNVYYAFTSARNEGIYLTWTKDAGRTWSKPVRASPPDLTAVSHPSMTAGDDGRVGLVFLGMKGNLTDEPRTWTWDAYMAVTHDARSEAPTFASVRVNDDPVYRGDCRNIRCGYIREFLDASVAPDGSFYGAFIDACLGPDQAKYGDKTKDCNTLEESFGEGNGHLAYVGHMVGADLFVGERKVSGGG